MLFVYTFKDYHWSVRENRHMTLQTLLSNQGLSFMLVEVVVLVVMVRDGKISKKLSYDKILLLAKISISLQEEKVFYNKIPDSFKISILDNVSR